MKPLLTACAAVLVSAVIGLTAGGSVDAAPAPPDIVVRSDPGALSWSVWSTPERNVLKLHNQARTSRGLSALSGTDALGRAAARRCSEITSRFSHTRPNGKSWSTVLGEFGISYRLAGENIAYGYSSAGSVHNAWMNSKGHRDNILRSSFRYAGVGHCTKGSTNYWVVLFTG
jgi:uncharacterized protein YkwD